MWQDLRYAWRRLADRPGFALVTILTLAAGIGLNTMVFQLINGLILRPLPGVAGEGVVSVEGRGGPSHSFPTYLDLKRRNRTMADLAAARIMPMGVNAGARSEVLWGYEATGNYFALLGVKPWRGRLFDAADDEKRNPVAVLSYRTWQTRFGSDPNIAGREIRLNGSKLTVVGVTPPGFVGTEVLVSPELWVPFSLVRLVENRDWTTERGSHNAWVIGRLASGVTTEQANAELRVLAEQIAKENPRTEEGLEARVVKPGLIGGRGRTAFSRAGLGLFAMAVLTLLVACTNLSNLLLAQAAARRREVAVRLAIGAGRAAIVRMMLAETLLLAALGGAAGLLLGIWLRDILLAVLPMSLFPLNGDIPADGRVTAFAAALTLATALLCGWVPAWRSAVQPLVAGLKGEAEGRWRKWSLAHGYLAVQVVASMVLVAAAGMTMEGLRVARVMKLGFEPEGAVVAACYPDMNGYDRARGRAFQKALLQNVRAIPGLENAGLATSIPLSIDKSTTRVVAEGRPLPPMPERLRVIHARVEPGFFRALGTRFEEGRDFTGSDGRQSTRVAVVNRHFADQLWPGERALGKRFGMGGEGDWWEVVGIVEGGKQQSLTEAPTPAMWLPLEQNYEGSTVVVARTSRPAGEVMSLLREEIRKLDPEVALMTLTPLGKVLDFPLLPLRIVTATVTAMGTLAAFLCGLGLYGVLANLAERRTREFGIRMALGAPAREIVRVALGPAGTVLLASGAVGLGLSLAITRVVGTLVMMEWRPAVVSAALPLMAVVVLLAAARPVRRALAVNPVDALRSEG